jgi:hypothetical protein
MNVIFYNGNTGAIPLHNKIFMDRKDYRHELGIIIVVEENGIYNSFTCEFKETIGFDYSSSDFSYRVSDKKYTARIKWVSKKDYKYYIHIVSPQSDKLLEFVLIE